MSHSVIPESLRPSCSAIPYMTKKAEFSELSKKLNLSLIKTLFVCFHTILTVEHLDTSARRSSLLLTSIE